MWLSACLKPIVGEHCGLLAARRRVPTGKNIGIEVDPNWPGQCLGLRVDRYLCKEIVVVDRLENTDEHRRQVELAHLMVREGDLHRTVTEILNCDDS